MNSHEIDLDSRYAVPEGVKYRHEDFGGVVYRRQDDRLFFLNSRIAVDLLDMVGQGTVREIIAMLGGPDQRTEKTEQQVIKALTKLKELGIIHEMA
jgi:putative mycofactocin binding protein MftB